MDDQISGLLTVLSLLANPPPGKDITSEDLVHWVIVRCWRQVRYRFVTAKREWHECPWSTMRRWTSQQHELYAIPDRLINLPKVVGAYIHSICGDIAQIFLQPLVPFNKGTIELWIHCLARLLSEADELVTMRTAEPKTEKVALLLSAIHRLLRIPEVEEAILCSSLAFTFQPKRTKRQWLSHSFKVA